jgi:predicted nucleic acid-binding protein
MGEKAKVYLNTSVISALFDEKNPERKSLTEAFIRVAANFDVYISEITIAEVERTPDPNLQNKMRGVLSQFLILSVTDEAEWLAREYIRYGAVPESYPEDAYHIAVAAMNRMDYLSWNYKHIVRRRTRDIVKMVNTLYRLKQIEIMTPAELI